jgi:hypothetical protein
VSAVAVARLQSLGVDPSAEARSERELHELLGEGSLDLGQGRLEFFLEWFLPKVPADVSTGWALWTRRDGWYRYAGRPGPGVLLAHFRGQCALGGIYSGPSRVLVLDLDNQAGKTALHEGATGLVPLDPDLDTRMLVATQAQMDAVWFRSGPSYGLHRWTFLAEAAPPEKLFREGLLRLQRCAKSAKPLLEQLSLGRPGGAPGIIEIHPTSRTGSQGATIRAPFGDGSFLLGPNLQPAHTTPGQGIQLLMDRLVRRGPVPLADAFPGQVATQQAIPELGASPIHISTLPRPVRDPFQEAVLRALAHERTQEEEWVRLIPRCTGLLGPADRPDRDAMEHVMEMIARRGIPRFGLRHQCTHLMALQCRWRHLSEEDAQARVQEWIEKVGPSGSRDFQRDPFQVIRETKEIVAHAYRPGAPKASRGRRRPLRKPDEKLLRERFEGDGEAVAVALAVLEYVKTHGTRNGEWAWVCRIPLHKVKVATRGQVLTLRTRRLRKAFDRLVRARLIRLIAPKVPKRDDHHILGPQRGLARLYRVHWRFAKDGELLPAPQVAPARRGQVLSSQSFLANTTQLHEGGVTTGYRITPPDPDPDAVKGDPPLVACGNCGRPTPEGDFEGPSKGLAGNPGPLPGFPQPRQFPQAPPMQAFGPLAVAVLLRVLADAGRLAQEPSWEGGCGGEGSVTNSPPPGGRQRVLRFRRPLARPPRGSGASSLATDVDEPG